MVKRDIRRILFRKSKRRKDGMQASLRGPDRDRGDNMSIWNLTGNDAYVNPPPSRRLPRWFIPSLAVVVLVALIFWGIPGIVAQLHSGQTRTGTPEDKPDPVYSDAFRVVSESVADVFSDDDLFAERTTQVLYNDPVEILHDSTVSDGFLRVELTDGTSGFMREEDLTNDRTSIEPYGHTARVLVTDLTKRILSHESNGTMLAEVMMGTSLLVDYRGNGVYRVTLPGGDKGWIGSNGVVETDPEEELAPETGSPRYFVNSALTFLSAPYVANGLTRYGICPEGIAYIAGKVNGIELPRMIQPLLESGRPVPFSREEDGNLVVEDLEKGDLLFFAGTQIALTPDGTDPEPARMGIYVDYGQVLTYRIGRSDVRILNLLTSDELSDRLFAVRRVLAASPS